MLSAAFYLESLLLAAVAVCYSYVLVQPGMLLAPVQAWVRNKYRWCDASNPYAKRFVELDEQWWWKPLWGCYLCVAGQWGFWGFLLLGWDSWQVALAQPSFLHILAALFCHLSFTALTIFFAAGWRTFYALCQSLN